MNRVDLALILTLGIVGVAQAAPRPVWKPVSLPHAVRDQGVDFTLLRLRQRGTPQEPAVQAELKVTSRGALRPEWRPAALRLHTPGQPVLEPQTIYTVPGPKLDLRFQGAVPASAKLARLEVEFLRQEKLPPDRIADFGYLYVPRGRASIQSFTRNTALGKVEVRLAPSRFRVPRAGDPTHYLEVVVTPRPRPTGKATADTVRPGKLHLVVTRATAGLLPIQQLQGQTAKLTDNKEKYLFPFRISPTDAEINLAVALDRGKTIFFPPVKIERTR